MSTSRFEHITGEDLYRRLALGKRLVVLDVRTEDEFARRHIPGSVLIPLQTLDSRVSEVPNNGVPIAPISRVSGSYGVAYTAPSALTYTMWPVGTYHARATSFST